MDVMSIARPDPREDPPDVGIDGERARYEVDPDEMYPAALDHLRAIIAGEADYPPLLAQYVEPVRAAPDDAWDDARRPLDEVRTVKERAARAALLEMARLVFTALLRDEAGGPIGLRILKNDRWRL